MSQSLLGPPGTVGSGPVGHRSGLNGMTELTAGGVTTAGGTASALRTRIALDRYRWSVHSVRRSLQARIVTMSITTVHTIS